MRESSVESGVASFPPQGEDDRVSDSRDDALPRRRASTNDAVSSPLAGADLVIFDFDGPITRLLPDPEYLDLARAALRVVTDAGHDLPADVAALTDHGAVLVEVGRRWPHLLPEVDALCEAAEIAAAGRRDPVPGALQLLEALRAEGVEVAVVSNNGGACVHAFLDRFGLGARTTQAVHAGTRRTGYQPGQPPPVPSPGLVGAVFGRIPDRPDRLKPSPAMLRDAAAATGIPVHRAVMVGDSVTDVVAAVRAGMPAVGLTPEPQRTHAMRAAGAVAVLPDMAALAAAHASS